MIDTGYDFKSLWGWKAGHEFPKGLTMPKICPGRHVDFTREENDKEYLKDNHGHGTHIAGLIAANAGDADYCLVIIKYYDPKIKYTNNLANTIRAFRHAIEEDVDIINYSGGGVEYSEAERQVIVQALAQGIRLVMAAGNEKTELFVEGIGKNETYSRRLASNTKQCNYFPACYDMSIERVGYTKANGERGEYSNYGEAVTTVRMGTNVRSLLPNNSYGLMSGTSQATAIRTGEIVQTFVRFKKFDRLDYRKYLKSYKPMLAS